MTPSPPQQPRWIQRHDAPVETSSARERLVAALADGPRTVAQLARAFGLAQPTVLEQIRRALRDGVIAEVAAPEGLRRSAAERYYAPAAPVIRQPDHDLLAPACRAVARELAGALARHQGDLRAAFAMTQLARDGWAFADLWPYLNELICRQALETAVGVVEPPAARPRGVAWIEACGDAEDAPPSERQEQPA